MSPASASATRRSSTGDGPLACRARAGAHRRHRDRPRRRRPLGRAGLRGLPPAERQRRADRASSGSASPACCTTCIGLTNTHSVGVVRDALIAAAAADSAARRAALVPARRGRDLRRRPERHQRHARASRARPRRAGSGARGGPVAEGGVGSGTGMMCHGFKGGIGTASRVVDGPTVGVLVQANHGRRDRLRVNGVPVGRAIPGEEPAARDRPRPGGGSIIVIVATDAAAPPRPVRPAGAAGGARHRPRRRRGRALVRRPHPRVRDREPRPAAAGRPRHRGRAARARCRAVPADRMRRALLRRDRGDRGGDRERARCRPDDDRPRRQHCPGDRRRAAGGVPPRRATR